MHLSRKYICRESRSEIVLFFQFHPSLRLAPSLSSPNKRAFLVLDNEARFFLPPSFSLLPFSYFLNSGHNPLDVIFRPAPGLSSDRPARHCRGGYNIFKARRQFRHNANSRAHRGATAPARTDVAAERGRLAAAAPRAELSLPAECGGEQRGSEQRGCCSQSSQHKVQILHDIKVSHGRCCC